VERTSNLINQVLANEVTDDQHEALLSRLSALEQRVAKYQASLLILLQITDDLLKRLLHREAG